MIPFEGEFKCKWCVGQGQVIHCVWAISNLPRCNRAKTFNEACIKQKQQQQRRTNH